MRFFIFVVTLLITVGLTDLTFAADDIFLANARYVVGILAGVLWMFIAAWLYVKINEGYP